MSEAGHDAPGADRTVLVGVTGGIAIYKAVELVRGLVKDGFRPLVVTTQAAQRFVMPLTFAAVSQAPVLEDDSAWQASGGWFRHIEAARTARVMVVAPATANTLAKMAAGMADNLLTAIYLAFRGPTIVAPTMNWAMNEHPATVENLRVLAARTKTGGLTAIVVSLPPATADQPGVNMRYQLDILGVPLTPERWVLRRYRVDATTTGLRGPIEQSVVIPDAGHVRIVRDITGPALDQLELVPEDTATP